MMAVCKDLCALASLRLGVKFLCRPAGAEIYFGFGCYKYAAPDGAGERGLQPASMCELAGAWEHFCACGWACGEAA